MASLIRTSDESWLIHTWWVMTHSYESWLIHTCDESWLIHMSHDSFIWVMTHSYMWWVMTHSYMWWVMTHSYMWWVMTHSYMWWVMTHSYGTWMHCVTQYPGCYGMATMSRFDTSWDLTMAMFDITTHSLAICDITTQSLAICDITTQSLAICDITTHSGCYGMAAKSRLGISWDLEWFGTFLLIHTVSALEFIASHSIPDATRL